MLVVLRQYIERLDFGSGYRIYYAEQDDILIILLCAGDKSSQKKDIKITKSYWHELKERSDEQIKDIKKYD